GGAEQGDERAALHTSPAIARTIPKTNASLVGSGFGATCPPPRYQITGIGLRTAEPGEMCELRHIGDAVAELVSYCRSYRICGRPTFLRNTQPRSRGAFFSLLDFLRREPPPRRSLNPESSAGVGLSS